MPRKKIYENDSERQAAFRARKKAERVEVDRKAHRAQHARFERLQDAVYKAAQRGDVLAVAVQSASIETLLENLAAAFDARAADVPQNGAAPKQSTPIRKTRTKK